MVFVDFRNSLAARPFKRTHEGAKFASASAQDLAPRELALLRRFTGVTLLEYLLAPDEPMNEMVELAWGLTARGLIAPAKDVRH